MSEKAEQAVQHLRNFATNLGLTVDDIPNRLYAADDTFTVDVGTGPYPWSDKIEVSRSSLSHSDQISVTHTRGSYISPHVISAQKAMKMMSKAARKQRS